MNRVLMLGIDSTDSILLSRFKHKLPWQVNGNGNMEDIERKIFNETLLKLEEKK